MSEQENIKLVQKIYNNFKSGNIQGLLDNLAPNISWTLPELANVSFGGKRSSRESVAEFFRQVAASQEALRFEPKDFIAQGDRVVSLGRYEWRILETGRTFAAEFAHVFTIKDGAVIDFFEFTDTAAVERAYQKAMSA